MANFVHRKNTDDGPRYRVWNTVVDRYETPPLTRGEVIEYLDNPNAAERVARADENGTSSKLGDARDPDGPWDTETCEVCGGFHHAFVERAHGQCARCGEAEFDRPHGPPCVVGA
ncbi:hypothetical protein [Sandaracinus amylolyticus]|uniref:hypothetical protein n=1 Tax=Sandaracinus amylolyticus TaxID=927083 RepID=UPI001F1D1336|nr:hypothetical protein [Sandaracinus amylolyticus]UJR81477.1 Hypothetical protein I5071_35360 [Sandaracinus amylolyticus]